jgi:hypothetical protein
MTQEKRLLNYLQQGNKITRLKALTELGIFELSSRIVALQKQGYVFIKNRIVVNNQFGEKCSIVEYSLET